MCGIAGLLDTGRGLGAERLRAAVTAMRDTMVHRGPDDQGVWVDPTGTCALGHRRLAILDLSPLGRQPMVDDTGCVGLVLNGEIYNCRELAAELKSQGVRLRGQSDTEVLLHVLADQLPMHLGAVNGMYALALWNAHKRQLFLARDPFGKKPLYMGRGDGFFAFASELQALELLADLDLTVAPDALGEYLLLQYVHAPRTIYCGVEKLPPGHFAIVPQRGSEDRGSFWQFSAGARVPGLHLADSYAGRVEQLAQSIEAAVQRRLLSDVPLGAFLSGGTDSSLVVATMRRLGVRTRTFSMGFADSPDSEHLVARQVALHLGTEHHEFILTPDTIGLAPTIADALDEPNGDTSCLPVYLLSQHTRQHVTVVLSGDGGDEMFGGYTRYFHALQTSAPDASGSSAGGSPPSAYLGPGLTLFPPFQIQAFLGAVPASVSAFLERCTAKLESNDRPLLHRMRNADVEAYLPGAVLAKVDRMSMRFALEVRCPLLDVEVARLAAALSADDCISVDGARTISGKRILKDVLSRFLPPDLVHRPKTGFGLPASFWPPRALRDFAVDLLDSPATKLHDYMDRGALRRWLAGQQDPSMFSIYRLWPLLVLELWLRKRRVAAVSLEALGREAVGHLSSHTAAPIPAERPRPTIPTFRSRRLSPSSVRAAAQMVLDRIRSRNLPWRPRDVLSAVRHRLHTAPAPTPVNAEHDELLRLSYLKSVRCDASLLGLASDADLERLLDSEAIHVSWTLEGKALERLTPAGMTDGLTPGERRTLYYLIQALRPRSILEIGTGPSTAYIALAAQRLRTGPAPVTCTLTTVNPFPDSPSSPQCCQQLGCQDLVKFEIADSLDFLAGYQDTFDFIFLNGLPSAVRVYQQIPLALRRLDQDGLILLSHCFPDLKPLWRDDVVIPGPYLAVQRLINEGARLALRPLGSLPWPTRPGSSVTSLAFLVGVP